MVKGKKNKTFEVKHLEDGRSMLNLACGGRMHPEWNNIDFSTLSLLTKNMGLAKILRKANVLSERRFQRLLKTDPDIIRWDLRKGIPFEDNTFDVTYHSHFLEHLDKKTAPGFLKECLRVMKPSGIIRVVVPDLGILCRSYVNTLLAISQKDNPERWEINAHQKNIQRLLGQMVISEPAGTAKQPLFVRLIERFIRGDTSTTGEIHRWMYDYYTLKTLLLKVGFKDIRIESPHTGRIQGWHTFCLDMEKDGKQYKSDSIYMEGVK